MDEYYVKFLAYQTNLLFFSKILHNISNGDDAILQYLQGKRGIEKPPFDLPDFIKKTGIMEMRASLQEKEDQRTLKAKMRERARPKLGKIDIDYQKLHDAFFKLV